MTEKEKGLAIIKSNLSDELKIELLSLLLKKEMTVIQQPIRILEGDETPRKYPETWNDSGWWEQHRRDAQGDVDSIIHPLATWLA